MSVDEDVEHEKRERRGQRVQGEGQKLVVDDEVSRSQEVPVFEERYLPLLQGGERRIKRVIM